MLYYNVIFLRFLILTEFLVIITVLFYIIDKEINTWLFLIFLIFSVIIFCYFQVSYISIFTKIYVEQLLRNERKLNDTMNEKKQQQANDDIWR